MIGIYILILSDVILSVLAVYLGFVARFGQTPLDEFVAGSNGVKLFIFSLVLAFSSFMVELYDKEKNTEKKEVLLRIVTALGISFVALTSFYYMMPAMAVGRGILALSLGIFGLLQFVAHIGHFKSTHIPRFARRVLILGTGPLADQIGKLIGSTMSRNHVVAGYVNCANEIECVPGSMIIGAGPDLLEIARREKAHKIIVSLSERRGAFPFRDVLNCKLGGIEVVDAPSFYEQATGKILIENVTPSWLIFSQGFKITAVRMFYKRLFDIVFSLMALIAASPLMLILAVIVKSDSKGPVFYRQQRVGQHENLFNVYKFRTMRDGAENGTGAVWARKNDSRVTRVGGFFRKYRFDEIPQFYNVLKGEMSIVGPRPERLAFVNKLKEQIPYYSERHFVKPGITGWAQINYQYGASVEDSVEKLRYDLFYIKNLGLYLDMKIINDTLKVVLFGRGGR